jgi:23S rRNA (cytosine1962-C5)-methyltransferase
MIGEDLLRRAAEWRAEELAAWRAHPVTALRLFDGPREGDPEAPTIELFGRTAVIFDRRREEDSSEPVVAAAESLRTLLPTLSTVVWKKKASFDRGTVVLGDEKDLTRRIEEDGVRYAVRLLAHHDATFFLDTALLRRRLSRGRGPVSGAEGSLVEDASPPARSLQEAGARRVLNLFAYTGSLGVAARAGGATVVHVDKSSEHLEQAKTSYAMNGFPVSRGDFRALDFFRAAAALRKSGDTFDTVILDPPPLSVGPTGTIDLQRGLLPLVNKVRPLVRNGGELVVVVNSLFCSGVDLLAQLEGATSDGYATIGSRIDVPRSCKAPLVRALPSDPAPFEHPTKIVVLDVRKKAA